MEVMAVGCITYCFLCENCNCCPQVFLELFLSGPWSLGYSSDSLVRNLVRNSCASLVDSRVMVLPFADNSPDGALGTFRS